MENNREYKSDVFSMLMENKAYTRGVSYSKKNGGRKKYDNRYDIRKTRSPNS